MRPDVEVRVLDEYGRQLGTWEFEELNVTNIANDVGEIEGKLLSNNDRRLIKVGYMLQFIVAPPGQKPRPRGLYFMERGREAVEYASDTLKIGGYHVNSIAAWRIFGPLGQFTLAEATAPVLPWTQEGAAFDQHGPIDDMLKYYARYSIDEAANYGPERRSLYPQYRLKVADNRSQGFVFHYSARRKHLIDIAADMVKLAANPPLFGFDPFYVFPSEVTRQTGLANPFRLYWSIDQVGFGKDFSLLFDTRMGQFGEDRSSTSARRLTLSVETGTLDSAELVWDYSNHVNHLYINVPSVEDGADVLQPYLQDASDEVSAVPWRREDFDDPGIFMFYDSPFTADTARTNLAVIEQSYRKLREKRPVRQVSGVISQHGPLTPGIHFDFGDRLTIEHKGQLNDVHLDGEEWQINTDEARVRYSMDYADRPRRIRRGGFGGSDAFY